MGLASTLVEKRLARCRVQREHAIAEGEAERFRAEEEGLLDAMLGRNRSEMYGQDQESLRESYRRGLHEGQALLSRNQQGSNEQSILSKVTRWWCEYKQKVEAEEEGLLDAMLERNRLEMYGQDQESLRDSYRKGLREGRMLMGQNRRSGAIRSIVSKLTRWWRASNLFPG
jgi:hypothetical protein